MMANPLLPEQAVIRKTKWQTYDTITFTMSFVNGRQAEYAFSPGQFNMVSVFGIGEAPISVSSEPDHRGSFDHTVRVVGDVTRGLSRLGEGDVVGIRGPFGTSWPIDRAAGKDVLMVAGGIGLAPLRPVIAHILENRSRFGKVEILYGARTPEDLLFTDEYRSWEEARDIRLLLTVDAVPQGDTWDHHVGVVTSLYKEIDVKPANTLVMICGPQIMMRFGIIGLVKAKLPADQIYISLERRMKCGIGMCGHCQSGTLHICKDGPVFPYSRIQSQPLPAL